MNGFTENTTYETDTPAQRLEALSKTVEVVKDVFVKDIQVKDRIVEKCVEGIEKELDELVR